MGLQTWQEVLTQSVVDGPTLTAAASASCIPVANKFKLPSNYFYVGRVLKFTASGRISCAVTTPGTARFDIMMGVAGATSVYNTGALSLNTAGKTNVPWKLEVDLVCRAIGNGTTTVFFPTGIFESEAIVGAPVPTVGGNGSLNVPVGAPAVGAGTDSNDLSFVDLFFTQTVATGSLTVHNYRVEALN